MADTNNFGKINGWGAPEGSPERDAEEKIKQAREQSAKPYWIPFMGTKLGGFMSNDPKCTPITNPDHFIVRPKPTDPIDLKDK